MNKPTDQHIVPKCYLRAFVDPSHPKKHGPKIWLFERNSRKGEAKAPASVLTGNDVYTIEIEGIKDYTIETTLSKLEDKYARLYKKKIAKRLPLSRTEHLYFCAFVSAMMLRTSHHRRALENMFDQLEEHGKQLLAVHGKDEADSDFLKEVREAREMMPKTNILEMLPHLVNIFVQMKLAFICADESTVKFITSDNPLTMFNPDLQWQRFYGPGLGQQNIEVLLPLSPNTVAIFTWHNFRGYVLCNEKRVQEINRTTRGHCDKYFIASSSKVSRYWFSNYPNDPIFIARILAHRSLIWIRRKYRDLKYRNVFRKRKTR